MYIHIYIFNKQPMRFYWFRGINNGLTVFFYDYSLEQNLGWAGATFFLARNLDSFFERTF